VPSNSFFLCHSPQPWIRHPTRQQQYNDACQSGIIRSSDILVSPEYTARLCYSFSAGFLVLPVSNRQHKSTHDEGTRRPTSTAGLKDQYSKLQPGPLSGQILKAAGYVGFRSNICDHVLNTENLR
jgi:hypothetical protein